MLTGALPGSIGQADLEGNHSYKFIYSRVFGADFGCCNLLILLVGAARFELATPCAQGRCATRLRYAPTFSAPTILTHRLPLSDRHRGSGLFGFQVGVGVVLQGAFRQ